VDFVVYFAFVAVLGFSKRRNELVVLENGAIPTERYSRSIHWNL